MESFKESLRTFSSNLYGQIVNAQNDERKNTFISPVSIYAALAMVEAGSGGRTREQILKVLQLSKEIPADQLPKALGSFFKDCFKSTEGVSLSIANALFSMRQASIEPVYEKCVKDNYEATIENVYLEKDREAFINNWVAEKTMQKIPELLSPGSIDANHVAIIINALYFKGKWQHPFDPSYTRSDMFTKHDGSKKEIQMMIMEDKIFHIMDLDNEEAQAIRIPFLNSNWEMLIILPQKHDGIGKVLTGIQQPDRLRQILQSTNYKDNELTLQLPRFKLSEGLEVDVTPVLQAMGMEDVFLLGSADLTGISKAPGLHVSSVDHKAVLEVDEEGATAVAVTSMCCCDGVLPPAYYFSVKHPFFVALVVDKDLPVFVGHVMDPESNK